MLEAGIAFVRVFPVAGVLFRYSEPAHFAHLIWPTLSDRIGLPCLRSGRGGRWTGDARWSCFEEIRREHLFLRNREDYRHLIVPRLCDALMAIKPKYTLWP